MKYKDCDAVEEDGFFHSKCCNTHFEGVMEDDKPHIVCEKCGKFCAWLGKDDMHEKCKDFEPVTIEEIKKLEDKVLLYALKKSSQATMMLEDELINRLNKKILEENE